MNKLMLIFAFLVIGIKAGAHDYTYPFGFYNYNRYQIMTPTIDGFYDDAYLYQPEEGIASYPNIGFYNFVNY